jgi:hypothetical protein
MSTPTGLCLACALSSRRRPAAVGTGRRPWRGASHGKDVRDSCSPQPPLLDELRTAPAPMYSMPVVAFNLPDQSSVQDSVSMAQYNKRKRRRVTVEDVLSAVREPTEGKRRATRTLVKVFYQRDNESFSAWQRRLMHAFNPHRFALHHNNLCRLMQRIRFPGFSSPSWYVKLPNSFFCLHVEQLFAPFYNYCYEGGTTWWVVRREDRARLDDYLVRRAKMEYGVRGELSAAEEEAVKGLLYTKAVFLHPEDVVKAGVRLTEVRQEAGTVVIGDGDLVHFGVCTPATNANSTNEAVNFLPLQWLSTGLPHLLAWLRWLRDSWLPMQKRGAMRGASRAKLRAAMRNARTNELLALHCAPLWCHEFLERLQALLETERSTRCPHAATRQAIEALLKDGGVNAAVRNIQAALEVMRSGDVKKWLLRHSRIGNKVPRDYLKYRHKRA